MNSAVRTGHVDTVAPGPPAAAVHNKYADRVLRRADRRFAYVAVLPLVAFLGVFLLYPVVNVFYLSFTNADGYQEEFIGLRNYSRLLSDPNFWTVLLNNVKFLIAVPAILLVSLVCAVLIYERTWGWRFFRALFFLPSVISTVVVGVLFRGLFASTGPVNEALGLFHVGPIDWLGRSSTAITVIILALVWTSFGYGMLIVLSGMSSIDPTIYEAAQLDGASWLQRTFYITLPLISRVLRFVSVINVVYTFTSLFGFIFVMTSGGPGYGTTTLDFFIYLKGFAGGDMGGASAVAFLLFVIVLALTAAQFRLFRGEKT